MKHVVFAVWVAFAAGSCSGGGVIGGSCSLDACGGTPQAGANQVCDLATECAALMCVSYLANGDGGEPFCSADCAPDPDCADPLDPATCPDPSGGCPRDLEGRRGVCTVVQEVVPPGEPTNCSVVIAGTPRDARCACVPCEEVDPALCP